MEKLIIEFDTEYFHKALGITDERTKEVSIEVSKLVEMSKERGLVKDITIEGEEGQQLEGNKLLDILVNEIAQSEQERLLLVLNFKQVVDRIRQSNSPGFKELEELKRMLRSN